MTSDARRDPLAAAEPALDAAGVDAFVREHHGRLVGLARLVCLDPSEADDAVQSALEQAWRRRKSLRDAGALRSWLDRIVIREAIRGDRRRRSVLGRLLRGPREIPVEHIDVRASVPHQVAALRVAYEALPVEQRVAIALHLHFGYSVAETARIVDVPAETVRSRLRLGRERLRDALEERSR